jgi:hypothetical protein
MKNVWRNVLVGVWLVTGTFMLARYWVTHPDIGLNLPQEVWIWLVDAAGAHDAEAMADVQDVVALALAFPLIALLTFIGLRMWQRWPATTS